ncbi:MAG: EamA/RhaT family transporter, partial [Polyangiaceae bacterium]
MNDERKRNPISAGTSLALVAAVAFGVTTPLIKRFGSNTDPFTTASLLYAGASIVSLLGRSRNEAPLH